VFVHLFSPVRIGRLELKNRLIGAATVTNFATVDGSVSERTIAHYARRARGGAALVTVEMTAFHPSGRGWVYMLNLWDDKYIFGFKRLADAIHAGGARCTVQLGHCGRQTSRAHTHQRPVAPSAVAQFPPDHPGYVLPRALAQTEIRELVEAIGEAARRAAEAGLDGVEVHGAHGYLFHQFLSPFGNLRTDEYGGDTAGRSRFICEAIARIKDRCGADFPVIVKMDGDEYMPGGIGPDEAVRIAPYLERVGADAIEVSAGCGPSLWHILPPACLPSGQNVAAAAKIRAAVAIPVIVVGKIDTPQLAEDIVASGQADVIALARPLLCDPDFPAKAQAGRLDDIRPCLYCNQGCNRVDHQYNMTCAFNAAAGLESEFGFDLATAPVSRRILVIGGGPGGMEAARVAALRGHQVTLFERGQQLGGQMRLAARVPSKRHWTVMIDYYERQLRRHGVDIHLDTTADRVAVDALNPEVVVLATGARPARPRLPGSDSLKVTDVFAVLSGEGLPAGARVAVVGAQRGGAQIAAYLAERGCAVQLITRDTELARVAANEGLSTRPLLMDELHQGGVELILGAAARAVDTDGLVVDQGGMQRTLACDHIVLATGLKPENALKAALSSAPWQLYLVGDCVAPRGFDDAIREAFHLAVCL
jgi:2,4-dienoyl-CoA reductase-like NADH-dependent reductase (Old Yellow Enzyme family)/NADPH-dependent 2,4-dienoyl-CoA reductase/sulfur reductase-like enzyme